LLTQRGEYRWHLAQYNPQIEESGRIIRWYVTAIDIDGRKHAEQKLKQSETEFRTTTDAIRQEIAILSPDGKTLYENRVALEQFGLTREEVKAKGSSPCPSIPTTSTPCVRGARKDFRVGFHLRSKCVPGERTGTIAGGLFNTIR